VTKWRPDTCDCEIEYNKNVNWISTIKKCRLHVRLNGQALLNAVTAQNRRFNLAFSIAPTNPQLEIIYVAKSVNRLRIRTENLDNFDEHLPFEQPLTFFQNLRRVLRLNP